MADISHLERMGRELKCPICLSLLDSAVSLTCNHVFCNSCIQTGMKSGSTCPVCKVPFHRREIRPALHMDNLVSIYKNMEVDSGVNIFVSQTNPSSKLPGEDIQSKGKKTCGFQETPKTVTETPATDNQKRKRGKGSKKSAGCNKNISGSNLIRSSFPTKKRVQVQQYPPSETPPPTKLVGGNGKSITDEAQKPLVIERDRSKLNEKGEPVLFPFFWLREEDVERSSQQTDGDIIMDTPPGVPCFSDMKDLDDEVHCETSPKSRPNDSANGADLFDSEMFDWTQRACSPELCSSPSKMKIKDTIDSAGAQEKTQATSVEESGINVSATENAVANEKGTDKGKPSSPSLVPPENKATSRKGNFCKSSRSKALRSSQKKQGKKIIGEVSEVHNTSEKAAEHTMKNNQDNVNVFNSNKKDLKNKKKGRSSRNVTGSVVEDISTSCGAKRLRKSNNSMSFNLSTLVNQEKHSEGSVEVLDSKTRNKRRKGSLSEQNKYCFGPKGRQKTAEYKIPQTQDEALHFESANKLIPMDNGKPSPCTKLKKCELDSDNKLHGKKKVKFSKEGQLADKENITLEKIQKRVHNSLETEKSVLNLNDSVLRKCEASQNKIQCAFCRSAEESEFQVSGVMVSYLNGKPVNEAVNGAPCVIHVHKYCAEWAPNVYFGNNDVVNLESELKRSRRITCFFCGVKGAALGCYETSCRKSFHVPCAKLTPECRWDFDNFVMLCPLHANSKLPCEVPGKQSKSRESIKRNSRIHQPKISATPGNAATLQWKFQKKNKNLVLCCSALTADEKGLVSTLKRLSGVTVVKNWDLSVTHVIASTDEKGACRRTLKYLMGVLAGKWIMSIDWIIASLEAAEFIDEQQYEIKIDTHGIVNGPKLGRLRVLNKQPKLFNGYKFFFMGDFLPSYKSYLHDLVIAAGGIVLNRKPVAVDQEILSPGCPPPLVIYSNELLDQYEGSEKISILARRRSDAEVLSSSTGAVAASNSWILNCIAGSNLLELE